MLWLLIWKAYVRHEVRGASNEYPQHMFLWRTRENYPIILPDTTPLLRRHTTSVKFHLQSNSIYYSYRKLKDFYGWPLNIPKIMDMLNEQLFSCQWQPVTVFENIPYWNLQYNLMHQNISLVIHQETFIHHSCSNKGQKQKCILFFPD